MTRLELLFKKMDEAYDERGDFFFDPIPLVKEYLAERDVVVIGDPQHDFSSVLSPAQAAAVRILVEAQRDEARKFDDEEVDDEPANSQRQEYGDAFDELAGHPMETIDNLRESLRKR